jgi:sporulation protein YlmC with PRC-barrel domain
MTETFTKSADVQGLALVGRDGAKLGTVREMFVDLASGQITFLIVETPGLLGGSGKFHPVPWSAVRHDGVAGAFQANRTKDEFKASPSYDRDQLGDASYAWPEQATRYFSAPPLPSKSFQESWRTDGRPRLTGRLLVAFRRFNLGLRPGSTLQALRRGHLLVLLRR